MRKPVSGPDGPLLIIGGSDAGVMAGLRAAELDTGARPALLLADEYPNYSICGIPYHLSGETPDRRDLAHRTRAELDLGSEALVPFERPLGPLGASLEVVLPRVGRASGGEGTFTISGLDRVLGGAFAGTLRAELPIAPGVLRIDGRFRTFVRDLDALPSHCAGGTMRD